MKDDIDEIIRWFDFEKVRIAMVALDWHWHSETQAPSTGELVLTAIKLLNRVVEEDLSAIPTGGFLAENRNGILSLKFVLTDWDVVLEEEE